MKGRGAAAAGMAMVVGWSAVASASRIHSDLNLDPDTTALHGDDHENCLSWSEAGECAKNPSFMLSHCGHACWSGRGMIDEEARCMEWAENAECTKNPAYMELKCSNACGRSWR